MVTPLAQDSRLGGGSVDNIVNAYCAATNSDVFEGKEWYAVARTIALSIHPNGVGIIAALSPATAWDVNVIAAREIVDHGDTKWQSSANKDKARRIMDGEDALDVLGGNKVRAFYKAIAGIGDEPVIDRHALSVFIGRHAGDKGARVLERKGAYAYVAKAYRKAAKVLGVDPHTVQAVTWVTWRNNNATA